MARLQVGAIEARERIINAIRSNRIAYGWSIAELAQRTGISESTLKRFERTGIITSDKLIILLSTLNLLGPTLNGIESREHWTLEQHERYNKRGWRNA